MIDHEVIGFWFVIEKDFICFSESVYLILNLANGINVNHVDMNYMFKDLLATNLDHHIIIVALLYCRKHWTKA